MRVSQSVSTLHFCWQRRNTLTSLWVRGGPKYSMVEVSFPWFKTYDAPLGQPAGHMVTIDVEAGVFSRRFEHVDVLVNVTNWSAASLPASST